MHSNLRLGDKLQNMNYMEDNVPWSSDDDSDSETNAD